MRSLLVALALGGFVAVSAVGTATPAAADTYVTVNHRDWHDDWRWRTRPRYYRPYYRPPVVYYPPPPPAYYYPPPYYYGPSFGFTLQGRG
jgi:hypothetical protein